MHYDCHSKIKDKKGSSIIELMLVVALLALFGIATLSLALSGSSAYKGINEKRELDSDLRIALSYLDTKVKQNDSEGALSLRPNPNGSGKAIVVSEQIDEDIYETWIYFSEDSLREVLIMKGEPVDNELSFEIAKITAFKAEYDSDGMLLHLTVKAASGDIKHDLSTGIAVKSGMEVLS